MERYFRSYSSLYVNLYFNSGFLNRRVTSHLLALGMADYCRTISVVNMYFIVFCGSPTAKCWELLLQCISHIFFCTRKTKAFQDIVTLMKPQSLKFLKFCTKNQFCMIYSRGGQSAALQRFFAAPVANCNDAHVYYGHYFVWKTPKNGLFLA